MPGFNITVRISSKHAHYGGNLVSGAHILELFGDAVTGLSAFEDNDEGLLSSWTDVQFLKPVHPGDFIRIDAALTKRSKLRRFVCVTASRIIRHLPDKNSAVEKLDVPECVARASGIIVIPFSVAQRRKQNG